VISPIGDAKVRGAGDFVGAARFIYHLFCAELVGAAGQGIAKVD
jgi:hypothetical protein